MGPPVRERFSILLEVYENFEPLQDLMDKKGRKKLNELLALLYVIDYRSSKILLLLRFIKERFKNTLLNSSLYATRTFNELRRNEVKLLAQEIRNLKRDLFRALRLMEEIYSIVWKICVKNEAAGCEAVVKVSTSMEKWRDLIEEVERLEEELKTI